MTTPERHGSLRRFVFYWKIQLISDNVGFTAYPTLESAEIPPFLSERGFSPPVSCPGLADPQELRQQGQRGAGPVLPAGAHHDQPDQPHRRGRDDQLAVSSSGFLQTLPQANKSDFTPGE
jgi:hypothetical protein